MTSNEYPPPSPSGEDSAQTGSGAGAYGGYYPPAPGGAPHTPSYGSSPYPAGSDQHGHPGQAAYPGQQAYPAPSGYPTQSGYSGPQGYPSQQGYSGQQGYPSQQAYPGQQDYPGQQTYPDQQNYSGQSGYPTQPGYQHTQQLPPVEDRPDGPEARSSRRRGRTLLITALLAALLGGGVGGGLVAVSEHDDTSVNTGLRITNDTGAPAAKLDGTIAAAAAKIRPSVVTIEVSGSQESGTGSGVVIRADGYILTNDHVVAIGNGSGTIQVTLPDGRTAPAKIVGRDTSDDLAVIKADGLANLTPATFAKSSSLSVGQTVVAVGAPLGLSDTVTSGIVSSLSRPVRAGDQDQAVFAAVQTDAAINPGNSGGPLVDLNGSVVGINTAIATDNSGGGLQIPGQPQQSGNIGIGFAIPSDEASRIASELIATGKATHAVLGVEVGNQSSTQSRAGVALRSVTATGAAAKAGLKVGDVVTAIDGQRVTTADSLIAAIRNHAPNQKIKLTYLRGGKTSEVDVTLGSSDS